MVLKGPSGTNRTRQERVCHGAAGIGSEFSRREDTSLEEVVTFFIAHQGIRGVAPVDSQILIAVISALDTIYRPRVVGRQVAVHWQTESVL